MMGGGDVRRGRKPIPNSFTKKDGVVRISLTRGKTASIDEFDFELVSRYRWRACRGRWRECWYAIAHSPMINGKTYMVQMHRLILGAPSGIKVDHRDFDGLNNRRSNIRLATDTESSRHQRKPASWRSSNNLPKLAPSSLFKGVSLDKRHGIWKCQIRVGKKSRWIGYFKTEEEAARAYDRAAKLLYGGFAVLNFADAALEPQKEG